MAEADMGIPSRLIITITANLDIQRMPPEMLKSLGSIEDLKAWADNFKMDMFADPEFGQYCSVTVSTEEVL